MLARLSIAIVSLAFAAIATAQVKVGLMVSATGPTTAIGIPQKNTGELLPKSIGGATVEYIQLDDGGDTPLGEVMAFLPRHPAAGAGDPPGTYELGYVVGPAQRGRGLGGRSVRLLGDALVADLAARRLVLRIDDGNVASERLAAACGYRLTGAVADGVTRVWERTVG